MLANKATIGSRRGAYLANQLAPDSARLAALFNFLLLTTILLVASGAFTRLGVLTEVWILLYVLTALGMLANHEDIARSIKASWLILLLPFFTLLSTFWSADPARTLYASIQFIYTTLIGVWIGTTFQPRTIFQALCVAMALGVVASLASGFLHFVEVYDQSNFAGAERYFVGIYAQKNVLGRTIDLLCLSILVVGIQKRLVIPTLTLALALCIPLSAAKSMSTTLLYVVTLTLPITWFLARDVRRHALMLLVICVLASVALLTVIAADIPIVRETLASLGKDTTLTGRTGLWSIAWSTFIERPILGVGFQSFWQPGLFDGLQVIRQSYGVKGFHNAYMEVMVATGLIGGWIFVIVLTTLLVRNIRWFYGHLSIESLAATYYVVMLVVYAFFDNVAFRQHEINYMLLVTFFVASIRQTQPPRASKRVQSRTRIGRGGYSP